MYHVVTPDLVKVTITHSGDGDSCAEKRFLKGITVCDLKGKLELLTGGSAATMKLEVYAEDSNKLVCQLDDDNALLGSYPIDDGMRLHVVDNFLLRQSLNDDSAVEKFQLSEDEYATRKGTLREFLASNKLGKFNKEEIEKKEEAKRIELETEEKLAKAIKVGDRCEVKVVSAPTRRGTVMFVGQMDNLTGWWVGVKYDEPLGKNDGTFDGRRYFQCPPKYGGFTKVINVTVGDFPEEEFDLDEI